MINVSSSTDMNDPSNWMDGDILMCVEPRNGVSQGKLYTMVGYKFFKNYIEIRQDDHGRQGSYKQERFRFHSRPSN